jgi:hypothetical protein
MNFLFWPFTVLALALYALMASPLIAAEAQDLAGNYRVKGTDPEGNNYEGTAEITFKAGKTVEITWTIGNRRSIGLGRLDGNTLTVEYQGAVADRGGKAVYQVRPAGRLVGEWTRRRGPKKGTETLIPQK